MKTTVWRMLGMVWVCGPGKVLVVQEGNGHGKGEIERGHLHRWIGRQRGGEVRQGPCAPERGRFPARTSRTSLVGFRASRS
jgi:hypothetical protein